MGWFKKAVKNLRPDRVLKDPKKVVQAQLDPAGFLVRSGRSKEMPGTARSALDPGGFFDGRDPVKYPSYTPTRQLRLSAGAQKLYDQMKARSAARMAGQQAPPQQTPQAGIAPRGAVGRFVGNTANQFRQPTQMQQAGQAPVQMAQPMRGVQVPNQRVGGMMPPNSNFYADGGQVCDEHSKSTSKAFKRKPNGKPY